MRIDPVVALMDELDGAYVTLARARDTGDWDATRRLLAQIAQLHASLRETEPRTVIGAAHLLREAAALLIRSNASDCADRLRDMAGRLDEGERRISDLVWLRMTAKMLANGDHGRSGENASGLLVLALKGAARPILLYRAVAPPPRQAEPLRNETHG